MLAGHLVERAPEEALERRVGVGEVAVDVDLEDAVVAGLDHVLVPGPGILFLADHRRPVALGQAVGEAVDRRQDPGEEQRERQAPAAAPGLGQLDRRLDHEVAADAQDDEQLRERRARPGGVGPDVLQVAHQGLVDLGARAGDGQDRLEAAAGLGDEALLLPQVPPLRLGEDLGEDVEGPPGHVLALPVEGGQELVRVGLRLTVEGHEAGPVVGVAGLERLDVGHGEEGVAGGPVDGRRLEEAGDSQAGHGDDR